MNPILEKLGTEIDASLDRLRLCGMDDIARLVETMRAAMVAQDEALRDLVVDAEFLEDVVDEDEGTILPSVVPKPESFEELLKAFGYGHVEATDEAELAAIKASGRRPEYMDAFVHLSPVDHLLAVVETDAHAGREPPAGARQVRVTSGSPKNVLTIREAEPTPSPKP